MGNKTRKIFLFFLNFFLDISYFILYTWTAAGDGGGERRACGRGPPKKNKSLLLVACGLIWHPRNLAACGLWLVAWSCSFKVNAQCAAYPCCSSRTSDPLPVQSRTRFTDPRSIRQSTLFKHKLPNGSGISRRSLAD